jgi:cytochrome c-type biogenesis protein
MSSVGLALIAGILSTFSPCVLPLVPIVVATALGQHRLGPVALATGLALSFVIIGLFVATVGFAAGFDHDVFRAVAAILLIVIGVVLLVPRLQMRLATASGPVGDWAQSHAGGFTTGGLIGQFGVGLLLGVVWSPCVGPTLGAASVLAARAENLTWVALTMLAFGIGAALPLLAIGMMSRQTLARWRNRMLAAGQGGKALMGGLLVTVGILILTGLDKHIEAILVAASPAWLTELTTRF